MNEGSELKAGIYRHYKGQHYLVLGLAHDANAEDLYHIVDHPYDTSAHQHVVLNERTLVLYIGLELDGAKRGPRFAVRDYEDFFQMVHLGVKGYEDGTVCPPGHVPHISPSAYKNREQMKEALASRAHDTRFRVPRFRYISPGWEPGLAPSG